MVKDSLKKKIKDFKKGVVATIVGGGMLFGSSSYLLPYKSDN
jgi:hypothetical protein